MRTRLLAIIVLSSSLSCVAQTDFGISYRLGVPLQKMADHMRPAHQAVFSGNYRLPIKKHQQVWVGAELGIGNYAHKTIEQTFQFRDGSTTQTDVRYNSSLAYANAVLRYDIPLKGRVTPYVNLKGGYTSFYTSIYIEDPTDPDGCKALDKDVALKDGSMTWGYGGGFRVNISKKGRKANTYLLDFNVSTMRGGNVDYLNVKTLGEHNHNGQPSEEGVKPLTTKFINVNTQDIHEHQLAEVYNSDIRLLQVNMGLIMKFDGTGSCSGKKKTHCRKSTAAF